MKKYTPINLGFKAGDVVSIKNNLKAISSSILSVVSFYDRTDARVSSLEENVVTTWTTATRPTKTNKTTYIGINTTTNKLEYTYDGGSTWYNADGTTA